MSSDFSYNRIFNKILDHDWFSARLFVTQSAHDHVGVELQVSDLNFFKLDTHVIFTSITRALMASLAMFSTGFKT